jgi:hypothetical protein
MPQKKSRSPQEARSFSLTEATRERLLREGPVGQWQTSSGTHTALIDDSIEFAADGAGVLVLNSVLHGLEKLQFKWRLDSPGRLSVCLVEEDATAPPQAGDWQSLTFFFEEQDSDVGRFWVMREKGQTGFWSLTLPLVPRSD